MKYFITGLALQFLTLSAFSASLTSRVHSIDKGEIGTDTIVMLESGYTAFIKPEEKSLIEMIEKSIDNKDTIEIQVDDELNVVSVQTVQPDSQDVQSDAILLPEPNENMIYEPSIVSVAEATAAFKNMRRNYQNKSQCYNRAHIWTYEEFQKTGMKSGKLFLFFTSRYIRKYRYHWWFHVAPFAYVEGISQSNWRVLDRRYTSDLLNTKSWTNQFMLNDAFCPIADNYSDYRNHQQQEDCYLIPRSMYFWQPRDIEQEEITGKVKTQYYSSEINHAYWEAF